MTNSPRFSKIRAERGPTGVTIKWTKSVPGSKYPERNEIVIVPFEVWNLAVKKMDSKNSAETFATVAEITLETKLAEIREFQNLGSHILDGLKKTNVVTLGDLVRRPKAELLRTPNFGRKSLAQVNKALSHLGYGP